jgi:hypothetical protein
VKYWQVSNSICLWKPQITGILGCYAAALCSLLLASLGFATELSVAAACCEVDAEVVSATFLASKLLTLLEIWCFPLDEKGLLEF